MEEKFESTGQIKIKIPKGVKKVPSELDLPPVAGSIRTARSVNLQEYLDRSLADLKLQLNYYQNVCSRISAGEWKLTEIVDYLQVMMKSLNFDAISLMLLDPDQQGAFLPMVSRGYAHPPPVELETFWQPCIGKNGSGINWNSLLALAQRRHSPLVDWIEKEKIFRIGYSPVQDGKSINGFMIISSYKEKQLSPLASILLELCGGHIGLALAARKANRKSILMGSSDDAKNALIELKTMLSKLSPSAKISPEEISETIEKSRQLIDQALALEEE